MRKILPFLLLFLSGFFSYSYSIDLQKYQLTQVSKEEKIFFDEIKTFLVLKDAENRMIQLVYAGEMKDDLFESIMKIRSDFNGWGSLKTKAIQFNVLKDSIDVLVFIASFQHQNKDFLPYIPNGMSFIYQNNKIEYDFRILKNTISHKFKGTYENEQAFLDKLLIYIQEEKPEEFIQKKIEEMKKQEEKKVEEIKKQEEQKKQEESRKIFALKLFAGTGTLAGLSFGVTLYDYFEICPFGGFIYYETDDYGIKVKKMAAPAGMRLNIFFMRSELFQPYVFGGAQYNFGIQNYEKRMIEFFGAGEVIFKYFFGEVSYMLSKNYNGFAIGFGVQLTF